MLDIRKEFFIFVLNTGLNMVMNHIKKFVFAISFISISYAQQMAVPIDVQIPLLLKVLSLEKKNLPSSSFAYTIGIIYQDGYDASIKAKDQIFALLNSNTFTLSGGREVKFVPIVIGKDKKLSHLFCEQHFDAVYITPLRLIDMNDLSMMTKKRKILSLTGLPEYVEEGVAIGIGIDGDKAEVIMNLTSTREEGADFSSKILNLVRLIQ
jgi:hypothetical protein